VRVNFRLHHIQTIIIFFFERPSDYPALPATPINLKPIPDSVYVPHDDEERPLSAPKVVVPLKDLKVSEGEPVNLMTKILGYPIPSITWLHNNRPIMDSSRFTTNYDHTTGIASFKVSFFLFFSSFAV
jgi:hypothetical protein